MRVINAVHLFIYYPKFIEIYETVFNFVKWGLALEALSMVGYSQEYDAS